MISGKILFKFKKQIIVILSLLFYFNSQACLANTKLQDLLLPFKKITLVKFTYTETRKSVFFKKPLVSYGKIEFIHPDKITKEVLKPSYKKFIINKDILTITDTIKTNNKDEKIKKKQLTLTRHPKLKQFIDLLKALLSGEDLFLQKHYDISISKLTANENTLKKTTYLSWKLILTPKIFPDDLEKHNIKSIQIVGTSENIKSIEINGFAGEYSLLTIDKILQKLM
jgi:hypothetical protein